MNVLLIIMDSVQAKNTSLHGHSNNTTPFLSELSESATNYTQARAPSFFSLPSHATIFTGMHAPEHGVTKRKSSLSSKTIFEDLHEQGYHTGLFTRNAYLSSDEFGLNNGFEHLIDKSVISSQAYPFKNALTPEKFMRSNPNSSKSQYIYESLDHDQPLLSLLNSAYFKAGKPLMRGIQQDSDILVDCFFDWIDEKDQSWTATINFMDTHYPYLPADEHNIWGSQDLFNYQKNLNHRIDFLSGNKPWWLCSALESLYDGTIRQVDFAIKKLYYGLLDRGILDDTLFIVTSDHGEGFGERSRNISDLRIVAHSMGLHECLLHVPLIIKYPGESCSQEIKDVASIRKIYHLIKEYCINNGEVDKHILCPDVVYSYADLSDRMAKIEENGVNNFKHHNFPSEMHAIYQNSGDKVNKYVKAEGKVTEVDILDAQESMLINDNVSSEPVSEFVETIEVSYQNEELELKKGTEQQLKQLGYL